MEILRKNQKEMYKDTIIEMKNVCKGIISRFSIPEERINEFGDSSICILQPEIQRERRIKHQIEKQNTKTKTQDRASKDCGTVKGDISITCNWDTKK